MPLSFFCDHNIRLSFTEKSDFPMNNPIMKFEAGP